MPEYYCEDCGEPFDIEDGGYHGPEDRESEECHPFMAFITICKECDDAAV